MYSGNRLGTTALAKYQFQFILAFKCVAIQPQGK